MGIPTERLRRVRNQLATVLPKQLNNIMGCTACVGI